MINQIEASTHAPFKDLTLGYRLHLVQKEGRVSGTGHKWMENGRTIAVSGRTPISVEGTYTNGRLELTFIEKGRARTSGGTLSLQAAGDRLLQGSFSSEAAQSSGRSQARRLAAAPE
jgi:hypothetical protein